MSHPATPSLERIARARRPLGALLAVLVVAWAWFVLSAPIDATQGIIQKILYVHVPLAIVSYLGFIVAAIGGAIYLARHTAICDQLAVAGAEVGVVFCTLVMVTGPIWAKGTWGHWWSWDPRLTLTLLLWFVYVAYLLLRSFTEGSERTARFAAIYGIAGVMLIPLNYFAIDLAGGRSVHPENLQSGSLGAGMKMPFWLGAAVAFTAFVWLVASRWEIEMRRASANDRERSR